jgi:hypothetical protein
MSRSALPSCNPDGVPDPDRGWGPVTIVVVVVVVAVSVLAALRLPVPDVLALIGAGAAGHLVRRTDPDDDPGRDGSAAAVAG